MADDDAAPTESPDVDSTAVDVEPTTAQEAEADQPDAPDEPLEPDAPVVSTRRSHVRLAIIAGLVVVVALGGLTGWLGYRAHQTRQLEQQRETFLAVGRQGAINLTTLDFEHIDADVQRVLDSATGTFYDDFQKRAPSFVDVVKQVKSKSEGTVTEAGIEAGDTATQAEVLVAVTVKSVIVGQPEQQPRSWRMRLLVQKIQNDTKVSNVEFVP